MHIKDRTDNKIMKVFGAAFFFCAICYYVVAWMGVALYGDQVRSDILINITEGGQPGRNVIKVAYTVIPLMSIPVILMVAK